MFCGDRKPRIHALERAFLAVCYVDLSVSSFANQTQLLTQVHCIQRTHPFLLSFPSGGGGALDDPAGRLFDCIPRAEEPRLDQPYEGGSKHGPSSSTPRPEDRLPDDERLYEEPSFMSTGRRLEQQVEPYETVASVLPSTPDATASATAAQAEQAAQVHRHTAPQMTPGRTDGRNYANQAAMWQQLQRTNRAVREVGRLSPIAEDRVYETPQPLMDSE